MNKTFSTVEPITVRLRSDVGEFTLIAQPGCSETVVELTGDPDFVDGFTVELDGGELRIQAPDRTTASLQLQLNVLGVRLGRGAFVKGRIVVPAASSLDADVKAADLRLDGQFERVDARTVSGDLRAGHVHALHVSTASGDVAAAAVETDAWVQTSSGDVILGSVGGSADVQSGSGDVTLRDTIRGDVVARTSSGDLTARAIVGDARLSTASGDLEAVHIGGEAQLRSASGDIRVQALDGPVQAVSASGDVVLRRIAPGECHVRAVSGDIHVGVPSLLPIWTDVHTVSGDIRNRLQPVGEPEPGQPAVELRASTTSGDITLATAPS